MSDNTSAILSAAIGLVSIAAMAGIYLRGQRRRAQLLEKYRSEHR